MTEFEFNEDELVPPTWLDKDFFQMVLRGYEKDDTIVVNGITISPGSGKGDHLASIMFRVVADYNCRSQKTNSRSMIVKTLPDAEGFKKDLLKVCVFETEIGMYSKEVPKFEEVLRKHGDNTQLSAKMLYYSLEPRTVIVFEDLVAMGYSCVRGRFPSVEEVKGCLSKIAKWHAVSYKLAEEGDEAIKAYKIGLLSAPKEELPLFITGGFKMLRMAISKVKELEVFAEKLQQLEESLITKCNEVFNAHTLGKKRILVLCHGDFHAKNVMFKWDKDGNYEDVIPVDFQLSCYAPAVIDITYSLFMLLSEDLRKNNREEMIHYYFSVFLETLKKIGYAGEMPTLVDFYIDLIRSKAFELWTMSTFLPFVHAVVAAKGTAQSEDFVSSEDAQGLMYRNPTLIDEMKWLLPSYLHKGYLD